MKLNRRIEALEKELLSDPLVLLMRDGSVVKLPGDSVFNLLARACRAERTSAVELVARSVSSTEPGGAHMIDLARALLNSPKEDLKPDGCA